MCAVSVENRRKEVKRLQTVLNANLSNDFQAAMLLLPRDPIAIKNGVHMSSGIVSSFILRSDSQNEATYSI
jgi:hypothetical protein